jgi:membrane-associated protease RseP (regulator of RpoE activity)
MLDSEFRNLHSAFRIPHWDERGGGMRLRSILLAAALFGMVGFARADPTGWLGVYNQELTQPTLVALDITHGVLITDVVENSPAAKAGITTGDVILRVDSQDIYTAEDLSHYVTRHPDKLVRIDYQRAGRADSLELKLATRERQVEFSLDEIPQVASAQIEEPKPGVEGMAGDVLGEIRALHDEITSLEKEIEKLRKDIKKLEK